MELGEILVNYLWGFFIITGIIYALLTGKMEGVNQAILSSGESSLKIMMNIFPLMCLWLGVMNIAQKSGLLDILAKKLSKILTIIFPEIPKNHEAFGYIASNIIVNMVGLGNAATPFGLKAMQSLKKLNKNKDEASRSMITFLVINTSSVTLIPTTVITLRLLSGSTNPSEILTVSILVTILSCMIGILIDRLFYFLWRKHI